MSETWRNLNKLNTNQSSQRKVERASVGQFRRVHIINPNMKQKQKEEDIEVNSVELGGTTYDPQISFEELD